MRKNSVCLSASLFIFAAVISVPAYTQAQSGERGAAAAFTALEKSLKETLSDNARISAENKSLRERLSSLENDSRVVVNLNSILKEENGSLRRKQAEFESAIRSAKESEKRLAETEKQLRDSLTSGDACAKLANSLDAENKQLKNNPEASSLRKELEDLKSGVKNLESERDKAVQELAGAVKQREVLLRDAASMHHNLGVIFFKSREYKKAIEEFKRCFELDPLFAEAYYNLAVIYDDHLNDNAAAVLNYKKYLELKPAASDKNKVVEKMLQSELKHRAEVDSPLEKDPHVK